MNYLAVRDLKAPKLVRERLSAYGDVVVTNNGRPMAVMLDIPEGEDPSVVAEAVREARARIALSRMRDSARRAGRHRMSQAEINAEIRVVRKARRRAQ